MRNINKYGFSFVEIIVTITIIILVSAIGITVNNSYKEKSDNSRVTADIMTIENSLLSYESENSSLPMPEGNNNFFKSDSSYNHSYDDSETFGVYGQFTEETLPKKYLDSIPLDPKTNQYYSYGKTKESSKYELAGVNWNDGYPEAFVTGDYIGDEGPYNLIRSHNGPNFVTDKSREYFPYNPDERIMSAKIDSYTGDVTINGTISDPGALLSYNLTEGDTISVGIGSIADIYFSDGSNSILGDTNKESVLKLAKMTFPKEDNLVTNIKLVLDLGTLWTKATSLGDESGFEVYTTDSSAAVRGTIFGVSKDNSGTQTIVKQGEVIVKRVLNNDSFELLSESVNRGQVEQEELPASEGELEALSGLPDGVKVSTNQTNTDDEIESTPQETEDKISKSEINNNSIVRLVSYKPSDSSSFNAEVELRLTQPMTNTGNFIQINAQGSTYNSQELELLSNITIDNSTSFYTTDANGGHDKNLEYLLVNKNYKELEISVCREKTNSDLNCTKPKKVVITEVPYRESANGGFENNQQPIAANTLPDSGEETNTPPEEQTNVTTEPVPEEEEEVENNCNGRHIFTENGENFCEENVSTLEDEGFSLVAYAPFNEIGGTNLYKVSGGKIVGNSENIDFVNGGILIEDGSTDGIKGSLYYNGLNNLISSIFAFQFNIKGEYLKNENETKYLFHDDDNRTKNRIYRNKDANGNNILSYRNGDRNSNNYNLIIGNNIQIEDNKFYNIQFIRESAVKTKIKVYNENGILLSEENFNGGATFRNSSIFIGSSRGKTNQINTVLNSFKIYKK